MPFEINKKYTYDDITCKYTTSSVDAYLSMGYSRLKPKIMSLYKFTKKEIEFSSKEWVFIYIGCYRKTRPCFLVLDMETYNLLSERNPWHK